MKPTLRDLLVEERYLLPAINWMLVVVISAALATKFGGWEFGAITTMGATLFTTPLKEWSPKLYEHFKSEIKGWSHFTHSVIFFILTAIVIWCLVDLHKNNRNS